ncbi:MAG: hypothetical protein LBV08_00180 [Clostridiales bacterium]|jgi:hypothetical protein|nr:hypothetical protein [Clostridiales bacterium]
MKPNKNTKKKLPYVLIIIIIALCLIAGYAIRISDAGQETNSNNNPVEGTEGQNAGQPTKMAEDIPSSKPNENKSQAEIDATINAVLNAAVEYYGNYSEFTNFVTKNGFWFDNGVNSYISIQDLIGAELLENKYLDESICFLYLKPSDLELPASSSTGNSGDMEIFISYEIKSGFIITSNNLPKTSITKEAHDKILGKYITEDSYSTRIYPSDENFEPIKASIQKYCSFDDDIDFRSLIKDDRFATVIFSPKEKYTDVRSFILEKENNEWAVKIDNVAEFIKPYIEVNKRLINFNLELLPKYNLSQFVGGLQNDYPQYVDYLKTQGYIDEEDGELVFFSSIDKFSYMEFSGGKKYLGNFTDDGVFMLYPVQSIEEASITMLTLNENAPLFILRQC